MRPAGLYVCVCECVCMRAHMCQFVCACVCMYVCMYTSILVVVALADTIDTFYNFHAHAYGFMPTWPNVLEF